MRPAFRPFARRYLLVAGLAGLVCVAVLGFLWNKGTPQACLVRAVLRYSLPGTASVSVRKVSLASPFHASDLEISNTDSGLSLRCADLDVDYSLHPSDRRFMKAVTAHQVRLETSTTTSEKEGPVSLTAPDWRLLPKVLRVDGLSLAGRDPRSSWSFEGLSLDADLPGPGSPAKFTATGSPVTLSIASEQKTLGAKLSMSMEATLDSLNPRLADVRLAKVSLHDPDDPRTLAEVRYERDADLPANTMTLRPRMTARFTNCRVSRTDLAQIVPGCSLAFGEISVSGDLNMGVGSKEHPVLSRVSLSAKDLSLDFGATKRYDGDFSLALEGRDDEEEFRFGSTIRLSKGQSLEVKGMLRPDRAECNVSLPGWTQAQLRSILPSIGLEESSIPSVMDSVSGNAKVNYADGLVSVDSTADLVLSQPEQATETVRVTTKDLRLPASGTGRWAPAGTVTIALDQASDSSVNIEFRDKTPGRAVTEILVRKLGFARALKLANTANVVPGLDATVEGRLSVESSQNAVSDTLPEWKTNVDLTMSMMSYNGAELSAILPLAIKGSADVRNRPYWNLNKGKLQLQLGTLGKLDLDGLVLTGDTFAGTCSAGFTSDLVGLAPHLGLDGARGTLKLTGPARSEAGYVSMDATIGASELGWRDYRLPDSASLDGTGRLVYDELNGVFSCDRLGLKLGDSTVTFTKAQIQLDPLEWRTEYSGSLDLTILQSLGILEIMSGKCDIAGSVIKNGQGHEGSAKLHAVLDKVRTEAFGECVQGAVMDADAAYESKNGLKGCGTLIIANMNLGKFSFADTQARISFEGENAILTDASQRLFGAELNASATVPLLNWTAPVRFTVRISGLDLGAIAQEVNLADYLVEGTADGELAGEVEFGGKRNITLSLHADKGMSLSSEVVRSLVTKQYGQGGKKSSTVDKILKAVIGSDNRCRFDSADLNLRYEGERCVGTATLKSQRLSLTADVAIDPDAILALLEPGKRD